MANVDPIRRAEIGREKRARTRAQLAAAARSLFGRRPVESVTVDDVVEEAGVAKGTFYVHFEDLSALTAAVADELVRTFDELLQPQRVSMPDFVDARLTPARLWRVLKMAVKDKAHLKRMMALKESLSKPGRQWQR